MIENSCCEKCNSAHVIFSRKRQVHVCEECGFEFSIVSQVPKRRIFISYGHDEYETVAKRLRDDLKERGHEVWFDLDRLKPGVDWECAIEQGLEWLTEDRDSSVLLLLLTPHAVRRPDGFCLNEVAKALRLQVRIVPLMVVDSEPPLSICRIQWLDMRECIPISERESLYRSKFSRLLAAVEAGQLDFEGAQQNLISALKPLAFDSEVLHYELRFVGRAWVFERIQRWLDEKDGSRVFWIVGLPGSGKTALSSILSCRVPEIVALHLCKHGNTQKSDPRRLLTSLAYQLSTQIAEYETCLARIDLRICQENDLHALFDNILAQPLARIKPPGRPIVILIDALDEATVDGRNALARLIACEFARTPSWLRLIVTSRQEDSVTSPLQGYVPLVLHGDASQNQADIISYLRARLKERFPKHPGIDTAIKVIVARSEGVFLYAEHVCDAIFAGHLDLATPDRFPIGMGGAFWHYFERQFPDSVSFRAQSRPLLRVILAAHEPLSLGTIQEILGWSEEEVMDRLRDLGAMIVYTRENKTVRLFHHSLYDWLTDASASGTYYVAVNDGRVQLAEFCLCQYKRGVSSMGSYALAHAPQHLMEANLWSELLGDSTTKGMLTDLAFVSAKCAASLVFELSSDYRTALASHPALRLADAKEKARHQRCDTYYAELNDYAVRQSKGSSCLAPTAPPQCLVSRSLSAGVQATTHQDANQEQVSAEIIRLRQFASFHFANVHRAARDPSQILSLALNHGTNSPVSRQAEELLKQMELPFLKRNPGLSAPTLKPLCLQQFVAGGRDLRAVGFSSKGQLIAMDSTGTIFQWNLETGERMQEQGGLPTPVPDRPVPPPPLRRFGSGTGPPLTVPVNATGPKTTLIRIPSPPLAPKAPLPPGVPNSGGPKTVPLARPALHAKPARPPGNVARSLERIANQMCHLSLSSDGLATASWIAGKEIRLWRTSDGKCTAIVEGDAMDSTLFAVCPHRALALIGGRERPLCLVKLGTSPSMNVLTSRSENILSASLDAHRMQAITFDSDGVACVFDLKSGAKLRERHLPAPPSTTISAASQGMHIVYFNHKFALRTWAPLKHAQSRRVASLPVELAASIAALAISQNGKLVVAGASSGLIQVWNHESRGVPSKIEIHDAAIRCIALSPDDTFMASLDAHGCLKVWSLEQSLCCAEVKIDGAQAIRAVISAKGERLAILHSDGSVAIRVSSEAGTYEVVRNSGGPVRTVALRIPIRRP